MATTKPRITVTLEPEHYAVLSEVARLTKSTMSSIVADVVSEAAPIFARVVKLILEAEATKAGVGERVRELATEAELELMPMASAAAKTMDMFESQVLEAIARAKEQGGANDQPVAGDARRARAPVPAAGAPSRRKGTDK